jgi:hypothetical protein
MLGVVPWNTDARCCMYPLCNSVALCKYCAVPGTVAQVQVPRQKIVLVGWVLYVSAVQ